jgi:hypothetical protein
MPSLYWPSGREDSEPEGTLVLWKTVGETLHRNIQWHEKYIDLQNEFNKANTRHQNLTIVGMIRRRKKGGWAHGLRIQGTTAENLPFFWDIHILQDGELEELIAYNESLPVDQQRMISYQTKVTVTVRDDHDNQIDMKFLTDERFSQELLDYFPPLEPLAQLHKAIQWQIEKIKYISARLE